MEGPDHLPNPWWIPRVLGRVPRGVEAGPLRMLGLVGLALLFEEYDSAMLISALKHIARDLGMAEAELGLQMAYIRLGALPAFFLVPLADRIGRRPVFIGSTVLLGALTFATAFVRTPLEFVAVQALTRTFFVTGTAVAFVIVAEELPANGRGWGIGLLAAIGSLGHGLGAALFSLVDRLPYGWRALYVVGIVPVLCLPLFMRYVTETRRFGLQPARDRSAGFAVASFIEPIRTLFAARPLRAAGLSACGFTVAAAALPSFQFSGYFTQTELDWAPVEYSSMVIVGGGIGTLGNLAAGRLGDVFGRKAVGFVLLASFPLASFGFYNGTALTVIVSWVLLVFCYMGGRVILRALSTELFATSHRGAASGVFTVMETTGAIFGLLLVHFHGTPDAAQLSAVLPSVALVLVGTALVLLALPETRNRELDEH